MKFSYSLLKEILPNIPSQNELAPELNRKSFEVEEIEGDIMEIKLTSNRWSDSACHLGMAREAAAVFGLPAPKIEVKSSISKIKTKFPITIEKNVGCRRYIGVELQIKKLGKTPDRIKKHLEGLGQRSINSVVDILNYVMWEIGQPMHAYDADKVSGGIVVRRAKSNESLVTIDSKTFELSGDELVIADKSQALGIAGIKGGKSSEVTESTKRIVLEAANFDNALIYKTSRKINLATDASQRYGKNLSPELCEYGIKRAIDLLTEVCGAEIISASDIYPEKQKVKVIKFNLKKLVAITGVQITEAKANEILKRLGFVKKANGYEVPYWRMDVSIFEDLVEEVIRIYGLDEVKSVAPCIPLIPLHDHKSIAMIRKIREEVSKLGYDEVYNYSFSDSGKVELINPIAEDKKFLRNNLTNGLLKNIESNKNNFGNIRLFEIEKIFNDIDDEELRLGMAIYEKGNKNAFVFLKGSVVSLFDYLGAGKIRFEKEESDLSIVAKNGSKIGKVTVLDGGSLAVAEIKVDLIYDLLADKKFEALPEFPSVIRDISLWIYGKTGVGDILTLIEKEKPHNLTDVSLLDLYEEKERRGASYRLVFRSAKKTLTDEEVDAEMQKVLKKLGGLQEVEIR